MLELIRVQMFDTLMVFRNHFYDFEKTQPTTKSIQNFQVSKDLKGINMWYI